LQVERLRFSLGREEGGDVKVGGLGEVDQARIRMGRVEAISLDFDLLDGVFRQLADGAQGCGERRQFNGLSAPAREVKDAGGFSLVALVAAVEVAGGGLVVAGEGLVGRVGDSFSQGLQVKDAEQRVADTIFASRKPRGLPGSTVSIQRATRVSSTAMGLRSTPWTQQRTASRRAWR
jgi:hypothetical protein